MLSLNLHLCVHNIAEWRVMKVYYNVFGLRRGFDSSGRELLEWELLAKNNRSIHLNQ